MLHLVFFSLFLILILLLLFLNIYVYKGFGRGRFFPIRKIKDKDKVVLTFDDGPDPLYTPRILDILKKYNVRAVFFLVGENVRKYPQLAQKIVEEGHDIGNHSFNHANLLILKSRAIKKNIMMANREIANKTGMVPQFFRPPRGLYNKAVLDLCDGLGMKVILWSLTSLDWRGVSATKMTKMVLKKVKGGDIILFHDSGNIFYKKKTNHENTVRALPKIIEGIQKKGLKITALSDLFDED